MHRDLTESSLVADLKIAIVSPSRHTRDKLSGALSDGHQLPRLYSQEGGIEQARRIADQEDPDVILVEGSRHDESELLAIQPITLKYPNVAVVLLSPNQSPDYLRLAMRVGLREILPPSADRAALLEALGGIRQRRAAALPSQRGRILSFVGCKGGSGTTFLATNLAYALAARTDKKVALIDLNFQFGDAALQVCNRPPSMTIADVTQDVHRIDGAFLTASMMQVLPNFHILAAPEEPEQALHIRSQEIGIVLNAAAAQYDLVIVDSSRVLNEVTVRSMDMAETVYCVLQQSLTFMRAAQRMTRALGSLGYGKDKVRLIVNRYHRKGLADTDRIVATLRHEVACAIPDSQSAVDDAINQGIALLKLAPKDAVARCIDSLAASIVPASRESSDGWLKGLLTRH